ncbi:Flp pilus assembly protein CpaB [Paraconexibacter sp.]|uniref:Flp pilus assembly protein CpaB n=1 Tax=Paraconexibacter sp. TaxID=2949640 RepID=UPI0035614363
MTRRRRAALLAGLALLLGSLAASDVARREAALNARLAPVVDIVVLRTDLAQGDPITARGLALRRVPARYAPSGAFSRPAAVIGLRAAVPLAAGTDLVPALLDAGGTSRPGTGPPVRPGERVAELVARGSPDLVRAGSRVDVLVTRDGPSGGDGRTELALQDAEVLAAAAAPSADGEQTADRVAVSLRVTLRQAIELAAAEQYAREVRVLARATGDRGRGG